jgi:hypothetical protein
MLVPKNGAGGIGDATILEQQSSLKELSGGPVKFSKKRVSLNPLKTMHVRSQV